MNKRALALCVLTTSLAACAGEVPPYVDLPEPEPPDESHDQLLADPERPDPQVLAAPAPGLTVEQAALGYCSTAPVRRLSEQLIGEIECLRPGTMARIDELAGVRLSSTAFPFLQAAAASALGRVGQVFTIDVNSSLRTTVQQYVLYRWYKLGRCTDVVSLAAPPGKSNHEAGLAVDIAQYGSARTTMAAKGFAWLGSSDPVHYDYVAGGGLDLRPYSVKAFQRLWNRNHPEAPIPEDGVYGAATEAAIKQAPAAGFAKGPACGPVMDPAAEAIEVYWAREASGTYQLRALASANVQRVEYKVDGYLLASATRAGGDNFPASYAFSQEGTGRFLEVNGYDASGQRVARGVGSIDVTAGVGVVIKQMGAGLYEIGLERAPAGVAAVEVRADGTLLTDGVSGQTRASRLAVRSTFGQLGARTFTITTFNADGTKRGTITRDFTLE
jgi:hypothetical protein